MAEEKEGEWKENYNYLRNDDMYGAILDWNEAKNLRKKALGIQVSDKNKFNSHERNFMRCLTPPGKITTTFGDIGALARHQEVLKTLIQLPIERPDIYNYGVLKNSSSSILLFGPPGTGKTLLAKAVAGECKANFLAVACADIMDKFVGESEKNVRAVFSLARKLQPAVIFLDELDALFMSRNLHQHAGQREVVNQLMMEWDGYGISSLSGKSPFLTKSPFNQIFRVHSNNEGIIVMGATNRPFDLDEAVLRRMPRKLLVDLPDEDGRKQILTVILRDELLETSTVSPAQLATLTKNYSGSDLKNMCVAAALAAVKEQLAANPADKLEKRLLTMAHFQRALKDVKASTSNEAPSSIELRKWDSIYGEGKKVTKHVGFS